MNNKKNKAIEKKKSGHQATNKLMKEMNMREKRIKGDKQTVTYMGK